MEWTPAKRSQRPQAETAPVALEQSSDPPEKQGSKVECVSETNVSYEKTIRIAPVQACRTTAHLVPCRIHVVTGNADTGDARLCGNVDIG